MNLNLSFAIAGSFLMSLSVLGNIEAPRLALEVSKVQVEDADVVISKHQAIFDGLTLILADDEPSQGVEVAYASRRGEAYDYSTSLMSQSRYSHSSSRYSTKPMRYRDGYPKEFYYAPYPNALPVYRYYVNENGRRKVHHMKKSEVREFRKTLLKNHEVRRHLDSEFDSYYY